MLEERPYYEWAMPQWIFIDNSCWLVSIEPLADSILKICHRLVAIVCV